MSYRSSIITCNMQKSEMAFEWMSLFGFGWMLLSGNSAVRRTSTNTIDTKKNEIRLPNNVKNISFAVFASANKKHEYYIFLVWHLSRSWCFLFKFFFSRYFASNFPWMCVSLFRSLSRSQLFIHLNHSHFAHRMYDTLLCHAPSKVNFISIDIAIFPISHYILHLPVDATTFSVSICWHRCCLQNHHCVFTTSTLLTTYRLLLRWQSHKLWNHLSTHKLQQPKK